jgi:hypothetical protein
MISAQLLSPQYLVVFVLIFYIIVFYIDGLLLIAIAIGSNLDLADDNRVDGYTTDNADNGSVEDENEMEYQYRSEREGTYDQSMSISATDPVANRVPSNSTPPVIIKNTRPLIANKRTATNERLLQAATRAVPPQSPAVTIHEPDEPFSRIELEAMDDRSLEVISQKTIS